MIELKSLSRKEISLKFGQKTISGQLNIVISKLLKDRLIAWTIPDKPLSSKQQHYLTDRGKAFLSIIRQKK